MLVPWGQAVLDSEHCSRLAQSMPASVVMPVHNTT
jgi:hypothetical protein